ncbi:MAG: hypothetical protein Salg2KO_01010 [Salibacteraceae bacterium]
MGQLDTVQLLQSESNRDSIIQLTSNDSILTAESIEAGKQKNQANRFSSNLRFAQYLITQELYNDAEFLLMGLASDSSVSNDKMDSATYLLAWLQYFQRDFDEALYITSRISNESSIYNTSAFLGATCYLYLEQFEKSKEIYENLTELSDGEEAVRMLNLAGIALLTRSYAEYDSINNLLPQNNYLIATETRSLESYANDMTSYKRKSPFLAGLLSAIVPGLGKYYVGYRGTPFGALTLNVPLAAIAVETLIITGWTGIPFLIAAPLFGVFYLGNIWGSALSPYAHQREFYDEMDHNILYDLHIPVRRLF